MQLYHHPYSLESQKVRLALEEKGIDYTSYHVNPITGKNMDSFFFRMNPSAKLPVFQNGSRVLFHTIDIIQYVDRVLASSRDETSSAINSEVMDWMEKIDSWNPKMFTLAHIPSKYRLFVSKFIRRVIIARMADFPDLASTYHVKLRQAYETEDKLKNPDLQKQSEEKLIRLLDDAETQLSETPYIAGEEFSMADCMFVPVLARISLLDLEDEYINCRPKVAEYYKLVKHRPSYKIVIGRYFSGWRKYRTLLKTSLFLGTRRLLKRVGSFLLLDSEGGDILLQECPLIIQPSFLVLLVTGNIVCLLRSDLLRIVLQIINGRRESKDNPKIPYQSLFHYICIQYNPFSSSPFAIVNFYS